MTQAIEMNFDGIVGPTHHYGGLSYGNTASIQHGHLTSNPKKAALQGLEKMRKLMSLGIKQGIMPPQERPFIPLLHHLGFTGKPVEILQKAWQIDPQLVIGCSSAACMWAANAATVSPSADSRDGRLHFTPANLLNQFHRSFEAVTTGRILHTIFNHPAYFAHHYPLPYHALFSDEGAANHLRFCKTWDHPGVQVFVFGKSMTSSLLPKNFPARQTEEASQAIARLHRLSPSRLIFAQQNPEVIDAGVFHNDVIAVSHQNFFLYHERAFVDSITLIQHLRQQLESQCQTPLLDYQVKESEVSLAEAIKTYLFNSQIVTLPDQTLLLLAPQECQSSSSVQAFLQKLLADQTQPIRQVIYQDIRESMKNGGGPACLRLRVVLTRQEYAAMHHPVELTEALDQKLVRWIEKHYRDQLTPDDLSDPQLLQEGEQALDALTGLLELGNLYSFQQMRQPILPELHT